MALFEDGTVLSRYTILGKLATGGMAEVYLARQSGPSGFSKLLVLKVILPHLGEDPEFLQMFHNEAKLAALLNHPNVVQIFDFGEEKHDDDDVQYMAMEYIDGLNLRSIVKALEGNGLTVPIPIAIRLVSDACSALEYAHNLTGPDGTGLEIIHRDVSLANILLTYTGQVKLVDFGIAKAAHIESFTSAGALRGKYRYMPPEQIRGAQLDRRADIFSLGVVLYRLLTGKLPFEGNNHAQLIDRIVNRPPEEPRGLCPEIPEELERITLKTLQKEPDQRYQRASELQTDLEAFLQATGNVVMPYNLSRFMEEAFPSGEDELRQRYQRLAGISSRTPPRQRHPGDDAPATGPLPRMPTPAGALEKELLKATVTGEEELPASEDESALARATLQDPPGAEKITQVEGKSPLDEAETKELGADQDPSPALDGAKETLIANLDEILAEAQASSTADEAAPVDLPAPPVKAEEEVTPADLTAPPVKAEEVVTPADLPAPPVKAEEEVTPADLPVPTAVAAEGADGLDKLPTQIKPGSEVPPTAQRKRSPVWIVLLLLLLAGGGITAYLGLLPSTPKSSGTGTAVIPDRVKPVPPDQAAPPASAPDLAPLPVDLSAPAADVAVASQDQAAPPLDQAAPTPDQPAPPPDIAVASTRPDQKAPAPTPALAAARTAKLSVSCPLGGDVRFNGKRLGKVPLSEVEVPAGKGRLVLRHRQLHFSISRNLTLTAGQHKRLQLSPGKGTIRIMVRPWAKVTLDGKQLGTTPLAPVEVYEGRHVLLLVNGDLDAKKRERVTVRSGKESVVKVRLAPK